MKNKIIWIVLLIIGTIPLVFPIIYGLYSYFFGFSFFKTYYGFEAMYNTIMVWSFIYWPTYIIGIILIILSTIIIRTLKNK